MLRLTLPADIAKQMEEALRRAGSREVGGILMGEHISEDSFAVREITIHQWGAFASFLRRIEEALAPISRYFDKTGRQYTQFNYIGEWHSHPSFVPSPSGRDSESMHEIVNDPSVGANFAALVIVKLNSSGSMIGTAQTYFPGGRAEAADLKIESVPASGSDKAG